jgi:DNA invertase Pin-like site-specific DNA recombinase
MLHSLSAQVDEYTKMIKLEPEWEFAGVYADEPMTGTKDSRAEFQRLIADCENGLIEMIITKSISRFARNTITVLSMCRKLKKLGIDVYFEREKIHTLSSEGELMLSILASYAQEESRSNSENQKWKIKKMFEEGEYNNFNTFGYDKELNIIPNEAEIIKQIFELYLQGNSIIKIGKLVGWSKSRVRYALSNERYIGDLLLQKTYTLDYLSKKTITNNGEKQQYFVADNHEPIISREDFARVQELLDKRAKHHKGNQPEYTSPLKGKIKCGICGKNYLRKRGYKKPYWVCSAFMHAKCTNKQIREDILLELIDNETADKITVYPTTIELNGITKPWQNKSRSESWTDDMKRRAREQWARK